MALGDSVLAVGAFTLAEAYFLQRTILTDTTFQRICLSALGVNILLKAFYNIIIWPLLLSPTRHLPKVKVGDKAQPKYTQTTNLLQGSHVELVFDSPRGTKPLQWMKTVPNEGLIHMRDTFNRSYVIPTNHQALLDVMSTNTYDFEKPWRMRNFLARIIGFGMITSEGAAHKKQRKALTPAFNIKNIRSMYSLMWSKTGQLLDELEKEIKVQPMDGTGPEDQEGKIEMSEWARYVL
jgi:hypothetical protein